MNNKFKSKKPIKKVKKSKFICARKLYVDITSINSEQTGSCIYFDVSMPNCKKYKFTVDAGAFLEEKYKKQNFDFPFCCSDLLFSVLTSNKLDYMGKTSLLYSKGMNSNLYVPKNISNSIAENVNSAYNLLVKQANNIFEKKWLTADSVKQAQAHIQSLDYVQKFNINKYIALTFFDTPLKDGSASVLTQLSYPDFPGINVIVVRGFNKLRTLYESLPYDILQLPMIAIVESSFDSYNSEKPMRSFSAEISYLRRFRNLKLVCVNNGSSELKRSFAINAAGSLRKDIALKILNSESTIRVNSFGYGETLNSRLSTSNNPDNEDNTIEEI